ncbi:SRPBCC family protein [Carboxylicivirga linearis]|uniref:GyrI-like domain-containing protein n=1 Tax=Carboxylicivirga linearis TaxID=1628157 RepID=A0ABS5JT04_9BACT|nr:GyrI-like domain-containing protein [Carboxylicivirga linearis]MBS2097977.1 GyrI-like domain-containing protein [Carboxylicivirga linearis]
MIYALLIFILVLLGLTVWLASIDGSYYITRSIELDVSREKAFELISDFNTWTSWSPWLCLEPDANVSVSKDGKAIGAVYKWTGKMVGVGEIEHKSLKKDVSLEQEIRFLKPFKSRSDVFWMLSGKGEMCELTWGMKGKMPFLFKFMAKNMEPWIGMDYERGLKMIKDKLELGSIASEIKIDGIENIQPDQFIATRTSCNMKDISSSMKEAFNQLNNLANDKNIQAEKALAIYHNFDIKNPVCEYSAGIITSSQFNLSNGFYVATLPAKKALKVTFKGDYKHLSNAWSAAYMYARSKKLKVSRSIDPIEFYLTDPTKETDPAKWITEVYLPLK